MRWCEVPVSVQSRFGGGIGFGWFGSVVAGGWMASVRCGWHDGVQQMTAQASGQWRAMPVDTSLSAKASERPPAAKSLRQLDSPHSC